jgi:hypothetical protein
VLADPSFEPGQLLLNPLALARQGRSIVLALQPASDQRPAEVVLAGLEGMPYYDNLLITPVNPNISPRGGKKAVFSGITFV